MNKKQLIAYIKVAWFTALSLPFVWMLYQIIFAPSLLGADPAKSLLDQSGIWAIRSILLALAMTPLRLLTQQTIFLHVRRMTGLFAFFYALVHFLVYVVFFLQLDWQRVYQELVQRPYIIVGFVALLLYVPLAVTSTIAWRKRLKRNWVRLHQLVYVIGILAVIHMTWLKKVGLYDTWVYALILLCLFAIRVVYRFKRTART